MTDYTIAQQLQRSIQIDQITCQVNIFDNVLVYMNSHIQSMVLHVGELKPLYVSAGKAPLILFTKHPG